MEYAYDYNPKQPCYKSQDINEGTFSKWSKDNMYRTNYTNTFTQVYLTSEFDDHLTRNHCDQKIRQCQDIKDLSQGMTVKTHLGKRMHRLPRKDINVKNLEKILQVLVQLDIILLNITLVIKPSTLHPRNTENKLYKKIIQQLL